MPTFIWQISKDGTKSVKPRVLKAQFGDGYTQRGPDGLNSLLRRWTVALNNREAAELDAIEAFLIEQGGFIKFDWTPPHGAAGKWVCDADAGWERVQGGGPNGSIRCTFVEVPA